MAKNKITKQLGLGLNVDQSVNETNFYYTGLPSALASISAGLLKVIREDNKAGPKPWEANPYSIEEKISHNCIVAHLEIIQEYGEWSPALESLYDTMDDVESGVKSEILGSFQDRYAKVKATILTESTLPKTTAPERLDIIRKNADEIIKRVSDQLREDLMRVNGTSLRIESLDKVCLIATCHAFLSCKILEKPPR
jgi:hypothetical protein